MQLQLSDDLRSHINHCQCICIDLRHKIENQHPHQGPKVLTEHVDLEVNDTAPPGSFFSHARDFMIENSNLYSIGGNLNQTVIGASGMNIVLS